MYADINDFIADLDRRRLLSRIRERENPDLEIAAVTDRTCKLPGGGPGLLFEQPPGSTSRSPPISLDPPNGCASRSARRRSTRWLKRSTR